MDSRRISKSKWYLCKALNDMNSAKNSNITLDSLNKIAEVLDLSFSLWKICLLVMIPKCLLVYPTKKHYLLVKTTYLPNSKMTLSKSQFMMSMQVQGKGLLIWALTHHIEVDKASFRAYFRFNSFVDLSIITARGDFMFQPYRLIASF